MNVNPNQIQLSPDQQAELASVAAESGKPWPVVLHEALTSYREETVSAQNGSQSTVSFFDAANRLGLIGCLHGGPSDLSSNPMYMEGFGQDDG